MKTIPTRLHKIRVFPDGISDGICFHFINNLFVLFLLDSCFGILNMDHGPTVGVVKVSVCKNEL